MGLGLSALKNNFVGLPHPYKLTFAVTYRCQSRCITCGIWQRKPQGELTLDEIRSFAQRNPYFRWVSVTGGEPFLRSDIVDVMRAFVQGWRGLYIVTMPTNSLTDSRLVLSRIEDILEIGLPMLSITVSLDGYRRLHDEIRGVPGAFDKAMQLARSLRSLQEGHRNLSLTFGYTMSRYNAGMLERTYEEVRKELPFVTRNDFHINVAQTSDMYYGNAGLDFAGDNGAMATELESFVRLRGRSLDAMSLLEGVFLKKLIEYLRTGRQPMRSRSLDASVFLDSYGNVFPSVMWNRRIGNIRDTGYDLAPLLDSTEAREARSLMRQGKEPSAWTACEAYQSIAGNLPGFASLLLPP